MVLSRVLKQCKRFLQRTDGASGIEYAVVAAMVAVAIITVSDSVGNAVTGVLSGVVTALTS
ncbi:Flp family type IVb pilin [Pseudomonas aegrilactucae]|uniref:Flp family type IVb pilin n=1 Tax=Pseudomonas aegrilactucae TaxID=2854028 RepID=A0A9Q2XGM5_9PSED|nr:Flp family type IVb pilin [Pseudomonas aegrilactucae]MBV6286568.1 Flp family type IVb pilin [Pseudomonas aegrilactucae]